MTSTPKDPVKTLVVDSIHGDIHLTPQERAVIDTPSFQRLRYIKQLGMGHVTYPNATHTRFAHSLGVLGIMERVVEIAAKPLGMTKDDKETVRLAGLLHDVGHYPYSHLMERVDTVKLTEEFCEDHKTFDATYVPYPKHVELSKIIVTSQQDIIDAVGGTDRAQKIASLFDPTSPDTRQLSKLIHSSLDVDRLDYLLRDAHATGVPFGMVDLNYLLNNLSASPTGMLGILEKALPAAEHYLFARFFMYRTVYFHKTTFGIEEACRQLLRRLRDSGCEELASDGEQIRKIVASRRLAEFTDAYVDRLVAKATDNGDRVVCALAQTVGSRKPPKLLKEVCVFEKHKRKDHAGTTFRQNCRSKLRELAQRFNLPLGMFLWCETRPLSLEARGSRLDAQQARDLVPEEKEELIKIFRPGEEEPVSILEITYSIVQECSNKFFQSFRLYVLRDTDVDPAMVVKLTNAVADWGKS